MRNVLILSFLMNIFGFVSAVGGLLAVWIIESSVPDGMAWALCYNGMLGNTILFFFGTTLCAFSWLMIGYYLEQNGETKSIAR
jgi:hypothetical protein